MRRRGGPCLRPRVRRCDILTFFMPLVDIILPIFLDSRYSRNCSILKLRWKTIFEFMALSLPRYLQERLLDDVQYDIHHYIDKYSFDHVFNHLYKQQALLSKRPRLLPVFLRFRVPVDTRRICTLSSDFSMRSASLRSTS